MALLYVLIATVWLVLGKPVPMWHAALLYAVMAKANLTKETACTSVKCSWLQPSHNAQVKRVHAYVQCVCACVHVCFSVCVCACV